MINTRSGGTEASNERSQSRPVRGRVERRYNDKTIYLRHIIICRLLGIILINGFATHRASNNESYTIT